MSLVLSFECINSNELKFIKYSVPGPVLNALHVLTNLTVTAYDPVRQAVSCPFPGELPIRLNNFSRCA